MIYEDILPEYLAIGVTWEQFMDSCPKELEPYEKAYKNKIKEQDYLQYMWWGSYGVSALTVAIDKCIHGRKAKAEYVKEPIFEKLFENDGLTEEIYEKELKKALLAEEQWIIAGKQKGLPKTII